MPANKQLGAETGATAAARSVGGTLSGPPTTGTFQPGDEVIDQSGGVWVYRALGADMPQTYASLYNTAVLADSPLGYWLLNETAAGVTNPPGTPISDQMGTIPGISNVGVTSVTGGIADGDTALIFAGTGDVRFTDNPALLNTASFSVEFWAKWTSASVVSIINRRTVANVGPWTFDAQADGSVRFNVYVASAYVFAASAAGLNNGLWHHFVGSYDGTAVRLYADRVLVSTSTSGSVGYPASLSFQIARNIVSTGHMAVSVQKLAYYGTALSQARVDVHYLAAAFAGTGRDATAVHKSELYSLAGNGPYIYNVKSFGAKGDGTTDDTAAFKSWSARLAATTRTNQTNQVENVATAQGYIPAGSYLITDRHAFFPEPATISRGLKIKGDGMDVTTILFRPTGSPTPNPFSAPGVFTSVTASTLPLGTYTISYTYVTAAGETKASPAATLTTVGGNASVNVSAPAVPIGVTSVKVYLISGPSTLGFVGSFVPNGNPPYGGPFSNTLTFSAPGNGVSPPATNAVTAPVCTDGGAASTTLAGGAGALGDYLVAYTYVDAKGETAIGPNGTAHLATTGNKIHVAAISNIPAGITSLKFYLTTVPSGMTAGFAMTTSVTANATAAIDIIVQGNATAAPDMEMIDNNHMWFLTEIEDMSFFCQSVGASFMLSHPFGTQDYTFTRCAWSDFKYGWHLFGSNNNSPITWNSCNFGGVWTGAVLWSEDSDQYVGYYFNDCTFSVAAGDFCRMSKGGHVKIDGGDFISQYGPTTFFNLLSQTHNEGATSFQCNSVRMELHSILTKIIYSEWNYGTIAFDDCLTDTMSYLAAVQNYVTATFNPGNNQGAFVTWKNCGLQGKHEYIYTDSSFSYTDRILYQQSAIRNFNTVSDFLVFTASAGHTNLGAIPVVRFEGCRASDGPSLGDRQIIDCDYNWQLNRRGQTRRRIVTINNYAAQAPLSGNTETVFLPLNAVILRARLYQPPYGTSASTGASMTIQTTEGSPTILVQVPSTPNQLKNGYDVEQELHFVCDSDVKRTIQLISNASYDQGSSTFEATLEYVG